MPLHDRVVRGMLDAAILVQPAFDLSKTVLWRALRKEPLVLVTPAVRRRSRGIGVAGLGRPQNKPCSEEMATSAALPRAHGRPDVVTLHRPNA